MKSSKSSANSKRKRREPSTEKSKTKRSRNRSRSKSAEKHRKLPPDSKGVSRKTRWHDKVSESKEIVQYPEDKESPQMVTSEKLEDLLDDKELVVEHIFSTLPPPAFQEIIPDYLKKYSKSELKRMCVEQIKNMSKDFILQLISGKDPNVSDDKKAELSSEGKSESQSSIKVEEADKSTAPKQEVTESPASMVSCHGSGSSSSDVLELFATSNEMEDLILDENKKTENKGKDEEESGLQTDAELLELEMRARAIRSLLRAKNLAKTEKDDETKDESLSDE